MTKLETDNLQRLVYDALHGLRMRGDGCFVVNAAALELLDVGPEAFGAIEEAILTVVAPQVISETSTIDLQRRFLGISDIWITYLVLAVPDDVSRAISFLSSLPPTLALSALIASQSAFRTIPKQAPDLEIPPALWSYFHSLAKQAPTSARPTALRLLKAFYRSGAKTPARSV